MSLRINPQLALALLVVGASCSSAAPGDGRPSPDGGPGPAAATRDPTCGPPACPEIMNVAVGHSGDTRLLVRTNPRVDDEVARWGDCLGAIVGCLEGDGELGACADQAGACSPGCADDVRARLARGDAPLVAFEGTYLRPGGRCFAQLPDDPAGAAP